MSDILGIIVIHAGILLFWVLIRRVRAGVGQRAFLGYYLVLLPAGFLAWGDPQHWLGLALTIAGLVIVTMTLVR
jgi:hypothetical protein